MVDYYTHLYEAYMFPEDYSIDEVFQLRKKTMYPREDVYTKVKEELERQPTMYLYQKIQI